MQQEAQFPKIIRYCYIGYIYVRMITYDRYILDYILLLSGILQVIIRRRRDIDRFECMR